MQHKQHWGCCLLVQKDFPVWETVQNGSSSEEGAYRPFLFRVLVTKYAAESADSLNLCLGWEI